MMAPTDDSPIFQWRPLLTEALRHAGGSHTLEDIDAALADGSMLLWEGPNSVIVTALAQYPQYTVCQVFLAAGIMAEVEAMYPAIEAWAKEKGCQRMMFAGRKGWGRSWPRRCGFQPVTEVFEKSI